MERWKAQRDREIVPWNRDRGSWNRANEPREINVIPPCAGELSADLSGKLKNFPVGIPDPPSFYKVALIKRL